MINDSMLILALMLTFTVFFPAALVLVKQVKTFFVSVVFFFIHFPNRIVGFVSCDRVIVLSCIVIEEMNTNKSYIVIGIGSREGVHNTLKCYQCQIEGTDETVCDGDLLTCPNNQAYDRCMINTKRNATTGQVTIIKACALAPCEFEKEVESIIFSGKCDLNRRGADCVRCCAGDGCNKRSGAEGHISSFRQWTSLPLQAMLAVLLINCVV